MFCAVNDRRAFELTLTIPPRGLWTADAKLDTGDAFTATSVTLTLSGLSLVGHVYRSGSYSGTTWLRMVGGRGGWHRTIGENYYKNPFGLSIKPILGDAAQAVGESIVVETDSIVGKFFVRRRGPAVRTLNLLATSWYARPDGVTYVGPRTTPRIASRFDVMDTQDLARGSVTVATDFPQDWTPGCLFASTTLPEKQASVIVHRLSQDKLRTEVWTSP